ncbi:MAG: UvrB/UvrC motif-containing protein [Planctomycetota bacterium]
MGKLCQSCNEREAKIHFTELKDGKKTEMHLCEHCAQEKNMTLAFPSLLKTLVKGGDAPASGESDAVPSVCPSCGLAYTDFKAKGRLGCPQCYGVFAPVLGSLLEKVHHASSHKGRCPPHQAEPQAPVPVEPVSDPVMEDSGVPEPAMSGPQPETQPEPDPIAVLRAQLTEAIASEEYERAAELRDQIRRLEEQA